MKNIDRIIKEIFIKEFKIKDKKILINKRKLSEIPGFDSIGWAIVLTSLESKLNLELDLSKFHGDETLKEFIDIIKDHI